jgi:hypothetical protein
MDRQEPLPLGELELIEAFDDLDAGVADLSTSAPPYVAASLAKPASTSASSVTSVAMPIAVPPAAAISPAAVSAPTA